VIAVRTEELQQTEEPKRFCGVRWLDEMLQTLSMLVVWPNLVEADLMTQYFNLSLSERAFRQLHSQPCVRRSLKHISHVYNVLRRRVQLDGDIIYSS
jgi:hypothetical protein